MSTKNPCARKVPPALAYEVYRSPTGMFTTFVLKKYKSASQEARDPFATWYVATQSSGTLDSFDFGDTYAAEVKQSMILTENPLCSYLCLAPVSREDLFALGIPAHQQTSLAARDPMLKGYYRVAVPKKKLRKLHNRFREFPTIRLVCQDDPRYLRTCKQDAQQREEE